MAAKKKSKKTEPKPTHQFVEVPNEAGKYETKSGERVDLHKFSAAKNVSTLHKVHQGTTIKRFLEDKGYSIAK